MAVLQEADHVIKEDTRSAVAVVLPRLGVRDPIARADEGADLLAVRRIGHRVQVGQAGADQVALFGALAVRYVHSDREPTTTGEGGVGPDGLEHRALTRAGSEVRPLADRRAAGFLAFATLRWIGVEVVEDVPLACCRDVVAERLRPFPIPPLDP